MAHRCPVCDALQPDGEHLANHLAITAILDREDHADWLEDHAPAYGDMGPGELAAAIVPHVETVDLEDEATPREPAQADDVAPMRGETAAPLERGVRRQAGRGRTGPQGPEAGLDAEASAVIEEARDLTAAMIDDERSDAPAADENDSEETGPEESS